MSDTFITLVSEKSDAKESENLAGKIIRFLIKHDIVEKDLTDCTLGNFGHKPGKKYQSVLQEKKMIF